MKQTRPYFTTRGAYKRSNFYKYDLTTLIADPGNIFVLLVILVFCCCCGINQ